MMQIQIRLGEGAGERVWAELQPDNHARLLDIPISVDINIYDVVRYDPESGLKEGETLSYRMVEVVQPSGYRAYLTWGVIHRPDAFQEWREMVEADGLVVVSAAWVSDSVRNLLLALPPRLSALETLVRLNRNARTVEVVCPLLAAHADDLERAKSDLERAVAWGGPDAEMTFAVAEAFEEQSRWDAAMPFWERLAHALPTLAAARERLAINLARLGVYPLAAAEFDRAAHLTDDPAHRRRLEGARDLMWERSKV